MPVESAFKLHLITLNRDRLARVMASLRQKLFFLKVVLTGPQLSQAQLQLRTLTPTKPVSHPCISKPSLLGWEIVRSRLLLPTSFRVSRVDIGWERLLWAPSEPVEPPAGSTYNLELSLFPHLFPHQEGQARPVVKGGNVTAPLFAPSSWLCHVLNEFRQVIWPQFLPLKSDNSNSTSSWSHCGD